MPAEKTALLPVSADEAFAMLTDPERLRRWKTVSARVDLRAGGGYRWTVLPGHVAVGTYREVIPGKRIVFGWGWEGSADLGPDASTVTITLEPTGDGTLVRLVHDGLTPEQQAENLVGWNHFFERLVEAATAGDAGPDPWATVPQVFDPLSVAEICLVQAQRLIRDVESGASADERAGVDQIVDSLTVALARIGGLADPQTRPGTDEPPLDRSSAESRLANAGARAVEQWMTRGLSGDLLVGGIEVPARLAAALLPIDLLVGGADLAAATGKVFAPAPEITAYVRDLGVEVDAASAEVQTALADLTPDASGHGPLARLQPVLDRLTA